MVDVQRPRTISPVMVPVSASFRDSHYSVFGDGVDTKKVAVRALTLQGAVAYVARVVSGTTHLTLTTALVAVLLAVPAISATVAYHVAMSSTTVGVVKAQYVPSDGTFADQYNQRKVIVISADEYVRPASATP